LDQFSARENAYSQNSSSATVLSISTICWISPHHTLLHFGMLTTSKSDLAETESRSLFCSRYQLPLWLAAISLMTALCLTGSTGHLANVEQTISVLHDARAYILVSDFLSGRIDSIPEHRIRVKPVLYPVFLMLRNVVGIRGFVLLQFLLNAASIFLVSTLVFRLTRSKVMAAISALPLIGSITLIYFSLFAMTEPLAVLLTSMTVFLVARHARLDSIDSALLVMAALTTAACIKPAYLLCLVFWAIYVAGLIVRNLRQYALEKGERGFQARAIVSACARRAPLLLLMMLPLLVQAGVTYHTIGSVSGFSVGSNTFGEYHFPVLYGYAEAGRLGDDFVNKTDPIASEAQRAHPETWDKVRYVAAHPLAEARAGLFILFKLNMVQKSRALFVTREIVPFKSLGKQITRFSQSVNITITCLHLAFLFLVPFSAIICTDSFCRRFLLLGFALAWLLLGHAALTYWGGDRFVTLAIPAWASVYAVSAFVLSRHYLSGLWQGFAYHFGLGETGNVSARESRLFQFIIRKRPLPVMLRSRKTAQRSARRRVLTSSILLVAVVIGLWILITWDSRSDTRTNLVLQQFQKGQSVLFDRTVMAKERARTYSEEDALSALGKSDLNGFHRRFEDATPSSVVGFTPPSDDQNQHLVSYEYSSSALIPSRFRPVKGPFKIIDDALQIENWNGDDWIENADLLDVPITEIGEFELRLKVREGTSFDLRVSTVEGVAWNGLSDIRPHFRWGSASLPIIPDNEFHTYRIQAKGLLQRTSGKAAQKLRLRSVLLRPTNKDGDRVEIDYLRIHSRRAEYAQKPYGSTYAEIDAQLRRVLFANTPLTLEYQVDLSETDLTLEFGMGILKNDDPVTFGVEIDCPDGGTAPEFSAVVGGAEEWSDVRLALETCRGGPATVRFRATAERGNVAFWSSPEIYSPPRTTFNVIVILEDALRADHMSCYGYTRPTTPFKEHLFREGVVFERTFSQATKTRPSVPSIMTSLYPTATGVWHLSDRLDDAYLTLAEIMRSQGFRTAAFIQNANAGPYAGLHQGFSQVQSTGPPTAERAYGSLIRDWIDGTDGRNFFLYLHLLDPHGRYDPPEPYRNWWESVRARGVTVNHDPKFDPAWDPAPTVAGRRARYDGEIRNNDSHLEGFVSWLEGRGLAKNTLLIFISDHGEFLGEHGLWEHKPPGFTQVLHVPLLLSYPARFRSGLRFSQPTQLIDVMPTVLDLAGVDTEPLLLQGQSLLPLILGEGSDMWQQRVVASEEVVRRKSRDEEFWGSLFFRDWHILNSEGKELQVFNLGLDPNENSPNTSKIGKGLLRTGADEYMAAIQRLNIEIWRSLTREGSNSIDYDVAIVEQLRELGYVD